MSQEQNTSKTQIDVVRPLLSSRWASWIECRDYENSTPQDRLTAICNYAEVKGSVELTEAEVERIIWAVEDIRNRAAWLDDCNKGECLIVPQWIYDSQNSEVRSIEPAFFSSNNADVVHQHRQIIAVQAMLLHSIEKTARISKGASL